MKGHKERKVDAAGFTIVRTFQCLERAMDWVDRNVNECRFHVIIDKDIHTGAYNVLDMGD